MQPDRYHFGEIDLRRKAETVQAAAEYELLLTDGMLRYARDLRLGQAGLRELDDDVGLPPDAFDPVGRARPGAAREPARRFPGEPSAAASGISASEGRIGA